MNDQQPDQQTIVQTQAAETAAKVMADAADAAKSVITKASETAANLVAQDNKRITLILAAALESAFGEKEDAKRFVDISRIPLICKSILDIHENITDIKDSLDSKFVRQESFSPVQRIAYGAVTMVLMGVAGAIGVLIFKK